VGDVEGDGVGVDSPAAADQVDTTTEAMIVTTPAGAGNRSRSDTSGRLTSPPLSHGSVAVAIDRQF
jgi:hypothetical protein